MVFQSLDFFLLFPLLVLVYFVLPTKLRWIWILLTSYGFYFSWNPWYILLLWSSTITDFWVAQAIHKEKDPKLRRRWLYVSLIVNLGLLGVFKYYDFFAEQFAWVYRYFNPDFSPYLLDVLLPVGISFYTFQTIGYTLDVYWRKQDPEKSLGKFAVYVSFFPQLIAGPIERAKDLMPQLHFDYSFDTKRVTEGLRLFLWGLFKKVVVADWIGMFIAQVYDHPNEHGGWTIAIAGYLFFFQIYYDFSAYQDMAVGTARILGVKLSKNFDPLILLSSSFRKFWRGWHITLTTWIRDYAYIPFNLQEKKVGDVGIGSFYVFFLVGLWHGANWTYIIWGSLHGVYMIIERRLAPVSDWLARKIGKIPVKIIGFLLFFNAFTVANIIFRSENLSSALIMFKRMLFEPTLSWDFQLGLANVIILSSVLLFALLLEYPRRKLPTLELLNFSNPIIRWTIYIVMGTAIWFLRIPKEAQFIYFAF